MSLAYRGTIDTLPKLLGEKPLVDIGSAAPIHCTWLEFILLRRSGRAS